MIKLSLFAAVVIWCTGIILVPVLVDARMIPPAGSSVLYAMYHTVCHQLPSHSFSYQNSTFPVCIRCTSIYFAFLFGASISFFCRVRLWAEKNGRQIVVLSLLPMAVDVFASIAGISSSTAVTRFVTGSLCGIGLAVVLFPMVEPAIQNLFLSLSLRTPHEPTHK